MNRLVGGMVTVVCPVYRNAPSLAGLVERLKTTRDEAFPAMALEIVLVDDGSDDDSWNEIARLREENPSVITAVKLSRNFGQVNAILAGLDHSSGDVVAVLSADLQDPPELLVQMLDCFWAGNEIVVAHRLERADGVTAQAFSRIAYGIARRTNPRIPVGGFDYVLMSKRAADLLIGMRGRHRFFQGDVLWLGFPTAFVPYRRQAREHGKSGWTLAKKWKYFVDLVLDGSYLPIQFMSRAGILLALAGLAYAIVIAVSWLLNRTPFPGWAPIMVTLLVVSGIILITLGIIAEYLWRIYDEVRDRPLYIVAESNDRAG